MLSHNYRIKLEEICERIVKGETVELNEIIWAEKLAKHNSSAATILRQARRRAANPDMTEDSLDGFLNALDLGPVDPDDRGISGFDTVDEIVDWFRRKGDEEDGDWRRRD